MGPSNGLNNEGMMKMRDGGDVPGVAGQGAREETLCVVDKMDDDHLDDLLGKLCECRWPCGRNL